MSPDLAFVPSSVLRARAFVRAVEAEVADDVNKAEALAEEAGFTADNNAERAEPPLLAIAGRLYY